MQRQFNMILAAVLVAFALPASADATTMHLGHLSGFPNAGAAECSPERNNTRERSSESEWCAQFHMGGYDWQWGWRISSAGFTRAVGPMYAGEVTFSIFREERGVILLECTTPPFLVVNYGGDYFGKPAPFKPCEYKTLAGMDWSVPWSIEAETREHGSPYAPITSLGVGDLSIE
jgi:hypothetical protein